MILWAFLIGMALCAATLTIVRTEGDAPDDKLASAGASFLAWCAFGMLLMGGTYGLGIVLPGLVAAAVLVLPSSQTGKFFSRMSRYKFPLGIGALLCSLLTWIGVLNLMEDLPNG